MQHGIGQWSPTFFALWTHFVEDSFSTDQGWEGWSGFGMIRTNYIQAHLLLCGLAVNSVGCWGPLEQVTGTEDKKIQTLSHLKFCLELGLD